MRPQSAGRARATASAVGAVGGAVGGPLGPLGPLPAASSKARMGRVGDERVEMGAGAGVVGVDVGVVVRVLVQVLKCTLSTYADVCCTCFAGTNVVWW
jgi:hypothetical protein